MVPSPNSPQEPCFPNCLNWLLENQCCNGSWARPHHHSLLQKDILSSTLASVLALKKWGVGEEQINRGVRFIESEFSSANDNSQISPIGFDIIFPTMLDYAKELFLNLRLEPSTLNDLIHKSDLQLESHSSEGEEAYLAYIAEGIGKLYDWEKTIMKYQRKNGSLFNSPSTTAAAYMALPNPDSLNYLRSALKKFGNSVPAVYPLDKYIQLSTVDNLERLGISRYFRNEIETMLDETYKFWVQGDEEIFMDASTCALAFRLLRMNGYNVTSDRVTSILEECLSSNTKDVHETLELYRASELIISPDAGDLERQKSRLKHLLEQKISSGRNVDREVYHALHYPFYSTLDRISKRRNIEHYNLDNTIIGKTSYCSANFANKDFLLLSVEDFNKCQAIHCQELKDLETWVVENKLDELKFARTTFFEPELSDARMSWAKNGVLATVVDDFFDVGGSIEELKNLIRLVEVWDADVSTECCSQNVRIIFSALKTTICEIGDKGFVKQERSVMNHIIKIWLDLLYSMMKEAEWDREKSLPTMDEYMENAYVSFGLGPIVLPALYLVGPKLSEKMVNDSEYHNLFKLMSTCGRLLNDFQGYEREMKDGKLNAVTLYITKSGGEMTKEDAVTEMKESIVRKTRELRRLVLEGEKSSVLPKACKDLFWHMSTASHLFYSKDDGFTSHELFGVVNSIINEPIVLNELP
ncbi:hypothetical protein MIMGU_mgv1a002236mg [Erythranthe guttata]|uniref:Uncharacterized protein n=1 Tax=Erythranthe guttata TaxID=4155 RepID=A0A022QI24_ERYGU|nr:hypothetical protein MIMGU_mgv1a002236mg [Erythranthe guttata]